MSDLIRRAWRWTVDTLSSTDIDIEFDIERTLTTGTPGTCELKLYNLTREHRDEIHAARGRLLRVEAGYEGGSMPILFQGDVRRVDVLRDDADWIAKVTGGDGEHAIRTARIGASFGPGAQLSDVVVAIANAMGVGVGSIREQFAGATQDQSNATFPEGLVLHGLAAQHLSQMCRTAGLTWTVQDGVLQVIPRGQTLQRSAVLLRAASATDAGTGLVESPEVGRNHVVTAKALLIPDLVPGQRVQLESAVVTGLYRIEKAKYTGDTRGTDWYAQLDLREVT